MKEKTTLKRVCKLSFTHYLTESLSGSILDSSNKKFLKNILRDDKKDVFNKLFLEGLEESTNYNKQEDIFNRQQLIIVNDKKFEFNQNDPIFSISQS